MAKLSIKQRELKREALVAKFAKKYAELKAIIDDSKKSDEERYAARLELQKLPRNAYPTRLRNRCELSAGVLNLGDTDYQLSPLSYVRSLPRERTVFVRCRFSF